MIAVTVARDPSLVPVPVMVRVHIVYFVEAEILEAIWVDLIVTIAALLHEMDD